MRNLKIGSGYGPWTWQEIEHFHKHARVDLWHGAAIALYTGQRQADVIAMKWNDIDRSLNLAGEDRKAPVDPHA